LAVDTKLGGIIWYLNFPRLALYRIFLLLLPPARRTHQLPIAYITTLSLDGPKSIKIVDENEWMEDVYYDEDDG